MINFDMKTVGELKACKFYQSSMKWRQNEVLPWVDMSLKTFCEIGGFCIYHWFILITVLITVYL